MFSSVFCELCNLSRLCKEQQLHGHRRLCNSGQHSHARNEPQVISCHLGSPRWVSGKII